MISSQPFGAQAKKFGIIKMVFMLNVDDDGNKFPLLPLSNRNKQT